MREELEDVVPCSSLAVDSVLRVSPGGAMWGFCIGPYEARKLGLTGIPRASYVVKSAARFGFLSGVVAGVFTGTRCGMQKYRRKNDWVNSLVGGAVAGAVVATGARKWTQVVGTACLVSAFSVAADYSRTN